MTKYSGQSALNVYNNFEMSSKRNFKNLSPLILSTYEELFLDEGGNIKDESELIFFNILKNKSDIMVEGMTYNKFVECMDTIMHSGDNLLLNIIDKFVEDNYALTLDKITQDTKDRKKKVNTELQFSDKHAKDLLKISYLYRVMIPIISVYFYYNKSTFNAVKPQTFEDEEDQQLMDKEWEELRFDEVNANIFAHLFDKFATNPEALRNKLYRLTYSGVSKTTYSDKRFWLAAKNVAITERSEALEIYKKILTNAIPKLSIDADKNVISFLQSVINNQVDFLFQNKFKYHFSTLGGTDNHYSTTDDDEDSTMSESEKLEILSTRKNEGSYIIRKMNIQDVISQLPERFGVGVSDAEVKDTMTKITRNQIQEQIISLITFKYFQDKDALKFVSFYEYCYLLVICKKYLQQYKFIYLPQILTANCEKHRERVNISGKKVRPEILNSKKYTDMIDAKYSNFAEEIKTPFLSFIGTVYSSVFKDDNGEEIFDSTVKVGKIAEEVVDLARLV